MPLFHISHFIPCILTFNTYCHCIPHIFAYVAKRHHYLPGTNETNPLWRLCDSILKNTQITAATSSKGDAVLFCVTAAIKMSTFNTHREKKQKFHTTSPFQVQFILQTAPKLCWSHLHISTSPAESEIYSIRLDPKLMVPMGKLGHCSDRGGLILAFFLT